MFEIRFRDNLRDTIDELWKCMNENRDGAVLSQLKALIDRGLLVIESDQPVVIRTADASGFEVRQAIRVKLKAQERIDELEKELADLKDKMQLLIDAFKFADTLGD